MRVLVTGGCGFIGSHVVDALLAGDHEVRVLDSLTTAAPRQATEGGGAELLVGDVTDQDVVRRALRDVDVVCHQAAKVGLGRGVADLAEFVQSNDLGTAVLLSAMSAAGVTRLVLASSMVVYGEGGYDCGTHGAVRPSPRTPTDLEAGRFEPRCPSCASPLVVREVGEDATLDPRNGYAATKVAQEHLATAWAVATGGTAIALRYHNVYGPRLPRDTPYAGVAALFRSSLLRGEAPQVFEDGGQLRDFVHVQDVAAANVLALLSTTSHPVGRVTAYNIASGRPATVGTMAQALADAMSGPDPVVTGEFRLGDVRHVVASPAAAARELGFRAATTLDDGMADFARQQ